MQHAKRGIKSVAEFSIIGIVTFALQLFITLILTEIFHVPYYLSYGIALLTAAAMNFFLNRKITFASISNISASAERFLVLVSADLFINWSLTVFMVEALGIHYLFSMTIAAMMISAANYYAEGKWVFK